jgi:hypothetical protein
MIQAERTRRGAQTTTLGAIGHAAFRGAGRGVRLTAQPTLQRLILVLWLSFIFASDSCSRATTRIDLVGNLRWSRREGTGRHREGAAASLAATPAQESLEDVP